MVGGRCSLAHYCSVQCQRKAWKEHGHKMVCRKEDEFRVGDVAGSSIPFGTLSFCHPVRLIARADVQEDGGDNNHSTSQSSWHVESTLEDDGNGAKLVKTMSATHLVRIRPVLWCIKKLNDWRTVVRIHESMNADDDDIPNLTVRSMSGQRVYTAFTDNTSTTARSRKRYPYLN